jgi:hypothetical protein
MKVAHRIATGKPTTPPLFLIVFSSLGHVDKEYCHVFDFMLGMLWYNIPQGETDDDDQVRYSDLALLDLAFRYSEYRQLNELAYNSSYAASTFGGYSDDPEWRKLAYSFCDTSLVPNLTCSLLLFNTYDDISTITTDYYYPVNKGACNNSFTIGEWEHLETEPPTELIQDYYVCTNSVSPISPSLCLSLSLSLSLSLDLYPLADLAQGRPLLEYWYCFRKYSNFCASHSPRGPSLHLFISSGQQQLQSPSLHLLIPTRPRGNSLQRTSIRNKRSARLLNLCDPLFVLALRCFRCIGAHNLEGWSLYLPLVSHLIIAS